MRCKLVKERLKYTHESGVGKEKLLKVNSKRHFSMPK
jgi:hypothetical protein